VLEQAVPGSAKWKKIKCLRAELKRVEQKRDMLKKVVTTFSQPVSHDQFIAAQTTAAWPVQVLQGSPSG
jgi:hypothetical protein